MVLVGGAFGMWLGHEGGTLANGVNALIKGIPQSSFHYRRVQGAAHGPEEIPSADQAGILILDFKPTEWWEQIPFCK